MRTTYPKREKPRRFGSKRAVLQAIMHHDRRRRAEAAT